jgi:hypothetical protein
MKSSLQSLVRFLPLFCSCQFSRVISVPLLPSSYPGRLVSRNSTNFLYNYFARITQKIQPLYCWDDVSKRRFKAMNLFDCCLLIRCCGNMCTESLPNNELLFLFHCSGFRDSHHGPNYMYTKFILEHRLY